MKQEYVKPEVELVRFTSEAIMDEFIDASQGTTDLPEGWE